MHESESHLEANLARLLKSAADGEALLKEAERDRIWYHLTAEFSRRYTASLFPDRALAALGALQVLAVVWLLGHVFTNSIAEILEVPGLFLVLPVAANLACVPVAGMMLFRRNRGHVQTG